MALSRKSVLFITDALIASGLLFLTLFVSANLYRNENPTISLQYMSEDMINVLSEMKISEINSTYVDALIAGGNISYLNNSVLEQIGEFWSEGNDQLALDFAQNMTELLIPDNFGYNLLINGEEVYRRPKLKNGTIVTSRKIVSGLAKSVPLRGISTQVFLTSIDSKTTSAIESFGGFVGQGNISRVFDKLPSDSDIKGIYLELDAIGSFRLYINNQNCPNGADPTFYPTPSNLTSNRYNITKCNASINLGAQNDFRLDFNGSLNESFVGGGLVKIDYKTQTAHSNQTKTLMRYRFPFIDGLINLYTSYFVPGTIQDINMYLHFYSNLSTYLSFGGTELFSWPGNESIQIRNISNTSFYNIINSTNLTYADLSNNVVPLRMGTRNISFIITKKKGTGNAVLITDTSGSMDDCDVDNSGGEVANCANPPPEAERLVVAKYVDDIFINKMLENVTGNLIGLVEYGTEIKSYVNLTDNMTEVKNSVTGYNDGGYTCISCGIKRATEMLVNFSDVLIGQRSFWRFNNSFTAPPENWTNHTFDDSSWPWGQAPMGFSGVRTDISDPISLNLWDMAADSPPPVDFTSGFNSTKNTFGFLTASSGVKLLSEGFESGSWSTNSWTEVGSNSIRTSAANAHAGSRYVRTRRSSGTSRPYYYKTIDATGFENVTLSWWGRLYSAEDNERMNSQWRDGTSGSWTTLNFVDSGDTSWTFRTVDMPASADDGVFQIRFRLTGADNNNEGAYTDDINVTGDSLGIDDGWDWATYSSDPNLYTTTTRNMRSYSDPDGLSGGTSSGRLRLEIGGGSCGSGCGYRDSGAFGVMFYIDQATVDLINAGNTAVMSFDYEAFDREDGSSETEESSWIKARFGNSTQMNYLGYHLDTGLGDTVHVEDATKEILWDWIANGAPVQWDADDLRGDFDKDGDGVRNSGTFTENISKYINSEGLYYLEVGGKFDATGSGAYQADDEGIIAYFDNIHISIANKTGPYMFRKKFNISSMKTMLEPMIFLNSDDRAEVYVNSVLYINETTSHPGTYWNTNVSVNLTDIFEGENIVTVMLHNDDKNKSRFDLRFQANRNKQKAMLIMSDGEANYCYDPSDGGSWNCDDNDADQEAIDFACLAHNLYNISIYAVAFGSGADTDTLNQSACCDNCSHFYTSNNVTELTEIYEDIAEKMLEATRDSQSLMIESGFTNSILYNDSYIEIEYDPNVNMLVPGEITITLETPKFDDCTPSIDIPEGVRIIDAKITSYSSQYWTDYLSINGNEVFNLSYWGTEYEDMGDAFIIDIPAALIQVGATNNLTLNLSDINGSINLCSKNNSMFYTIAVSSSIPYGGVKPKSIGCEWTVEYEDTSFQTIDIPKNYNGTKTCSFTAASVSYDINDSVDYAVYNLLTQLDFNNNNVSDINFNEANLVIKSVSVVDIPTMWGPAITEVRIW